MKNYKISKKELETLAKQKENERNDALNIRSYYYNTDFRKYLGK